MVIAVRNGVPAPVDNLMKRIETTFGFVPNLYGVLSYHPSGLAAMLQLEQATQLELPAKLRELAFLKASAINGCVYCLHYHRRLAIQQSVSEAQISAICSGEEREVEFTDLERLVLVFAAQLTRSAEVDDVIVDELRTQLTVEQFVELVLTVGLANLTDRINHACRVELP